MKCLAIFLSYSMFEGKPKEFELGKKKNYLLLLSDLAMTWYFDLKIFSQLSPRAKYETTSTTTQLPSSGAC